MDLANLFYPVTSLSCGKIKMCVGVLGEEGCWYVGVWVCWERRAVGTWVCGCVGVCVGVWVCGCVGVWVCGCVGVWVCWERRAVGTCVCGCVGV